MTIRKGEEWGRKGIVPASFFIVEDDHDAASQPANTPFALCRGDMYTALGNPRIPAHHQECMLVPIDALTCSVTYTNNAEETLHAFSHITIGSWWRGRHIVISNCGFISGLNIAPRSHPNDGECDVVSIANSMTLRQRVIARRRARTGTHVPHPDISIQRKTHVEIARETPQERLSIDGVAVSNWRAIIIDVEPDYWEVIL